MLEKADVTLPLCHRGDKTQAAVFFLSQYFPVFLFILRCDYKERNPSKLFLFCFFGIIQDNNDSIL